ncbi:MAG: serine hydrolase [Chloroflexota bacterium]
MKTIRVVTAVLLVVCLAVLGAACGGGKGDTTPDLAAPNVTAEVPESPSIIATPSPPVIGATQELAPTEPTSIPSPAAHEPEPAVRDAELEALILRTLGPDAGSYGVVVRNLTTGTEAAVNPDKVFYAASLYKLPILYEMYKLRELALLDFDLQLELTPYYVMQDEGTLPFLGWKEGDMVSVAEAVAAMITVSDNASAWMLKDLVGWALINADMASLGLKHTTVSSREFTTSARDMALLLELMARGQLVSPEASGEMVHLLTQQTVRDRIPALLPSDTQIANKTGNWLDATHDVAIVYSPGATYVIAVLSDRSWESEPIAQISLAVYNYFQTRGR